jgi:hypothetical protein
MMCWLAERTSHQLKQSGFQAFSQDRAHEDDFFRPALTEAPRTRTHVWHEDPMHIRTHEVLDLSLGIMYERISAFFICSYSSFILFACVAQTQSAKQLSYIHPLTTGELVDRGDNTYGGKYVVNPSGGLISKGHPLGATGVCV